LHFLTKFLLFSRKPEGSEKFKGTVSRDGYFLGRYKHFNRYFLCMR